MSHREQPQPQVSEVGPVIRLEPTPRPWLSEAKVLAPADEVVMTGVTVPGIDRPGAMAQAIRIEFATIYVDEISRAELLDAALDIMTRQRARIVVPDRPHLRLEP